MHGLIPTPRNVDTAASLVLSIAIVSSLVYALVSGFGTAV